MANLYSQLDSHCIHGGYLYKKGVYNRAWKKRYFVLYDDRTISYFEKEKHAKSRNKAKGSIHLTQISRVEFVHYLDPTILRHKSQHQFNAIVTNNTHRINPKNKVILRMNSSKQNNYIQRSNLNHIRVQSAPAKDNKTPKTPPTSKPDKTRDRVGSPTFSFTTDDIHNIMIIDIPSKHLHDELIPYSPKTILSKQNRLKTFNDQNTFFDSNTPKRPIQNPTLNGWVFSPNDLNSVLSPIYSPSHKKEVSTSRSHSSSINTEVREDDAIFMAKGRCRGRSSSVGDIPIHPRSVSARPSMDHGQKQKSGHSSDRPQSATFSKRSVGPIHPWDEDTTAHHIPKPLKKKSTLNLPRPPPRKSFTNSKSDSEDVKEHRNGSDNDNKAHSFPNALLDENEIKENMNYHKEKTDRNKKDKDAQHRDIIVCDNIKRYKRELYDRNDRDREVSQSVQSVMSKASEYSLYNKVLATTTSDISADRPYSFALIQPDRNWILSAETENECKKWLKCLQLLVQGRRTYSGYLIKRGKNFKSWKKRYFVLFENKVLNYYHNPHIQDKGALIGDIDLRHTMWLRLCNQNEFKININDYFGDSKSKNRRKSAKIRSKKRVHHKSSSWQKKQKEKAHDDLLFEIATPNRTWIFCAQNETKRNAWFAQIRDVFSDKLVLKIYFDSPCHLQIIHMGQNLKNRYCALLKGWLIIFRDKNKLNDIRAMTFFSDTIFRDYVRNKNCICIPLKNADIVQNFKSVYGEWSFEIKIQDRCWYFNVDTEEILNKWLNLLTRNDIDYSRIEQSYSNLTSPDLQSGCEFSYALQDMAALKEVDINEIKTDTVSPLPTPYSPDEITNVSKDKDESTQVLDATLD